MSAVRIAIDASRTTAARITGTEYYARQLIHHLITLNDTLDAPHRISLYFRNLPPADLFPQSPNVEHIVIPFPRVWTHLRFAAALSTHRPDVTFVPAHALPFVFPGRAVVTVHDLGYRVFPEAHPFRQRAYLDLTTRTSAARAHRVLADSQATAADLTRFYGTSPEKIRVVYPGVEPPTSGEGLHLTQKYGLPARFFLFIGTLQPRKNIARLVRAYDRWRQANPTSDIGLVLAGGRGWLFDPAWTEGVPDVVLTGYIDEADKGLLLGRAVGLAFPSLYEGFGFPVVEAMHAGTPVIASKTSSLPELVGEAGLLIDPLNETEIVNALDLIAHQPDLRAALRQKGYTQAAQFTWERAARQTLDVLIEAAQS